MGWFVLSDLAGRLFFGQFWEVFNNSPRRPRHVMGPLTGATLCYGPDAVAEEIRRARAILGVEVVPVPVDFIGQGKMTEVALRKRATR